VRERERERERERRGREWRREGVGSAISVLLGLGSITMCSCPYCFQILDLGIILHPGSYLREFWNIMDAVVVICAAVSFGFNLRSVHCNCIIDSEY
jgi:hypothetical protein